MPNKYILYVITTIVTAIIVFAYTMREYYKGEKEKREEQERIQNAPIEERIIMQEKAVAEAKAKYELEKRKLDELIAQSNTNTCFDFR
ncbi:MAG: hypothetical protein K5669_03665 [Lachnospiraceae bacterium]|nr:hypothetical protein [Lachnospiraceae bacterium]